MAPRALLLLSLLLLVPSSARAGLLEKLVLDVEAGPLAVLRNDGRYGAQGTQYDASDVGQKANLVVAGRVSVEARLTRRHAIILLWAPLELNTRVRLEEPLVFRDTTFDAGATVDHRYLFEGYRASYLYGLVPGERLRLEVGGSFQLRNADVSFTELDTGRFAQETDVGPVFALKARLTYDAGPVWAQLEADALSTFGLVGDTEGGIYDVALTLGVPLSSARDADGFLRLRVVGGGAEVPDRELENWGAFFSASAGLRADLVSLFTRL